MRVSGCHKESPSQILTGLVGNRDADRQSVAGRKVDVTGCHHSVEHDSRPSACRVVDGKLSNLGGAAESLVGVERNCTIEGAGRVGSTRQSSSAKVADSHVPAKGCLVAAGSC